MSTLITAVIPITHRTTLAPIPDEARTCHAQAGRQEHRRRQPDRQQVAAEQRVVAKDGAQQETGQRKAAREQRALALTAAGAPDQQRDADRDHRVGQELEEHPRMRLRSEQEQGSTCPSRSRYEEWAIQRLL